MNSKDLIKEGKLAEARSQLIDEIKKSPSDAGTRTMLFQVMAFLGEWDKALNHLNIIATQDPSREPGVSVYRNIIAAEKERLSVFQSGSKPSFLPKAPVYGEAYSEVFKKLVSKKTDEAKTLFNNLKEPQPKLSGSLNGNKFSGFFDTDSFLEMFFEAFVHEKYVWIPCDSVREIVITPPSSLFDLIWANSQITLWGGLTLNCFLPVLYPETFLKDDEQLKLGRMTDWEPIGDGFAKGLGQHMFQTGESETALLEIRELVFDHCSASEFYVEEEEKEND